MPFNLASEIRERGDVPQRNAAARDPRTRDITQRRVVRRRRRTRGAVERGDVGRRRRRVRGGGGERKPRERRLQRPRALAADALEKLHPRGDRGDLELDRGGRVERRRRLGSRRFASIPRERMRTVQRGEGDDREEIRGRERRQRLAHRGPPLLRGRGLALQRRDRGGEVDSVRGHPERGVARREERHRAREVVHGLTGEPKSPVANGFRRDRGRDRGRGHRRGRSGRNARALVEERPEGKV